MNLIFNELSFLPLIDNDSVLTRRFLQLIEVFRLCNEQFGFNKIVFPFNVGDLQVTQERTFSQWVYNIPNKGEKNKILSQIGRPFINDVLEGQINITSEYIFENEELEILQTYCIGLATAHITERPSISLSGVPVWENHRILFQKIINNNFDTEVAEVFNIAIGQNLADIEIIQFVESISEVNLLESPLLPEDKPIHFRPDHGTNTLMNFARRIRNSVYVNSVINSLPFNPNTSRFLRNISHEGTIEIVLHWEDQGYGMVIQTTGRNYRETEAIAEILRDEYDR